LQVKYLALLIPPFDRLQITQSTILIQNRIPSLLYQIIVPVTVHHKSNTQLCQSPIIFVSSFIVSQLLVAIIITKLLLTTKSVVAHHKTFVISITNSVVAHYKIPFHPLQTRLLPVTKLHYSMLLLSTKLCYIHYKVSCYRLQSFVAKLCYVHHKVVTKVWLRSLQC
jgi:hypothetical protein